VRWLEQSVCQVIKFLAKLRESDRRSGKGTLDRRQTFDTMKKARAENGVFYMAEWEMVIRKDSRLFDDRRTSKDLSAIRINLRAVIKPEGKQSVAAIFA
jgi:hypothetical protein